MALTGACPGTLLPQLATGVATGPYVLAGGIIGGILYSKLSAPIHRHLSLAEKEMIKTSPATLEPALYQRVGMSEGAGVLVYEITLLSFIALATHLFPAQEKTSILSAAVGGLTIGLSQVLSLLLTTYTLGVSTAYEQIGDLFWWAVSKYTAESRTKSLPTPNYRGVAFPLGSILGAWLFSQIFKIPAPVDVDISILRAVFGGVLLVFGSRVASGCTSGHGISGMSMLSIASIASVVTMFGGGILTARVLG